MILMFVFGKLTSLT